MSTTEHGLPDKGVVAMVSGLLGFTLSATQLAEMGLVWVELTGNCVYAVNLCEPYDMVAFRNNITEKA